MGVGGMYSRSCEPAHEVDAKLWLSVGACIHVHDLSCELAHEVDATLWVWGGGWGEACIRVRVNLHMK